MAYSNEVVSRRTVLKLGAASLAVFGLNALGLTRSKEMRAQGVLPLNYDESNGDSNPNGQRELVAKYLRDVMASGRNAQEPALIAAIQGIQKEAQNANATVLSNVDFIDFSQQPQDSTWLVWISNRNNIDTSPADVQLPFGLPGKAFPSLQGQVAIVHAFDPRVPDRTIATFSCNSNLPLDQKFWAVAIK
jgi:hypothetical protein